jgi:hypothetical protein
MSLSVKGPFLRNYLPREIKAVGANSIAGGIRVSLAANRPWGERSDTDSGKDYSGKDIFYP